MIVKFDSLNRFEVPNFYLCNPGSIYENGVITKIIGCLSDTTDEELILNFNATSELNFRMYRIRRESNDENQYMNTLYRGLQNRRLIFVEGIGYFVISQVNEDSADGLRYKDIRAESCEIEIAHKALTFIEDGTYRFIELLEKIVATLPLWKIGHIDTVVKDKYRTFEGVSTDMNTLAFFMDSMQNAYECVFLFDTTNRLISVYDQANLIHETPILITENDVVNSIGISESSDDLYTAISVFGEDNLGIAAINPLGSNTIYDFSYYLNWMTPSLRVKVEAWTRLIDSKRDSYYEMNLSYYDKLTQQSDLQAELDALTQQITMYQRMRDNVVADGNTSNVRAYNDEIEKNGGTPISIESDVVSTLRDIDVELSIARNKLDRAKTEHNAVSSELSDIEAEIVAVHNEVAIDKYFTQQEYDELYNYIYEGSYTDPYVTVTDIMSQSEKFAQMKTLYDRAVQQLQKISSPTQEFSVDVENFIFQKEFEQWSEILETGCLINVELDAGDVALLFLSNMTVNYYDRSLNLTFGNRFSKFDPKSVFDNVLGNIQKTANTIEYIKDILYPVKNGEFNSMREALQNSRNLTMGAALTSTNEEVIIDGSGYTGRKLNENGEYDPRQIKITGRNIVFTDDAWESCKVAIGELILGDNETIYGINAQAIIGDIIIGNKLHIMDDNGNELFTVIDGLVKSQVSDIDGRVTAMEQTSESVDIRITSLENSDTTEVTTTTGYTFNADGLTISKSGEEMENLIDNTGMYVKRGDDTILSANNEGVVAINLHAKQYLICGENCRFEDYKYVEQDGEMVPTRTGCFYIGG